MSGFPEGAPGRGTFGGLRRVLLIAENELKAQQLYEDCRLYDPEVLFFPARDLIFYQADISGNLLTRQRMQVFKALMEQKKVSVITSTGGCMDFLLPLRVLKNSDDDRFQAEIWICRSWPESWRTWATSVRRRVDASGQFAVRGDILDVYPLTEENPWRIELWGDEVDSIRSFDPESQRSIENLERITIWLPAGTDGPSPEEEEKTGGKSFPPADGYLPGLSAGGTV